MAKIIVSLNGAVLQEVKLASERTSIGRHAHNDVVIDNRVISGEHAVIVMAGKDCVIEDMNSTNGTLINGQPIKKHFLQDKDVIELAKYKIQFLAELQPATPAPAPAAVPMPVIKPVSAATAAPVQAVKRPLTQVSMQTLARIIAQSTIAQGSIKVLTGANAGKQLALIKPITTIGRPGGQVAVITQQPDGYLLTHVEGDARPLLNGVALGDEPEPLADGDVIDIAGTRMGFAWAGKLADKKA
jgi:pSer/pThr/pTyr-binding forkhead associated (FHA) protein